MYGRNKKRIDSELFVKPKKSPETSMGSTLLSADDNNSVVRRPTNHINGVCFCYENKEDCTTCTEEDEESMEETDLQVFMLSDSDTDLRLLGGSSPTFDSSSSSDGSSLFDEEFSRKLQENLEINEKIEEAGIEGILSVLNEDGSISDEVVSAILTAHTGTTVKPEHLTDELAPQKPLKMSENLQKLLENRPFDRKEPSDKTSRAWLEYMIRKLSEEFDTCISGIETEIERHLSWIRGIGEAFGKMKNINGYQIRMSSDYLAKQLVAVEMHQMKSLDKIDNFDSVSSDFDVTMVLMKKCKEEHAMVRREYLDRLFDEDLMKSNLLRIAELKAKIEVHRKLCRPENVDTQVEIQQILDEVDTCQSFS